ncbi:MAG: O-antigen ligase family protein [Candidatus Omnitrophica bacterium]|nr:O-antigen ligase family protein [Candidatus Omnitrophota bacterium]
MNKLEKFSGSLFSIICLLTVIWLSFLPVSIYEIFRNGIIVFLFAALLISFFARKVNLKIKDWLIVLFLFFFALGIVCVKDKQSALHYFIGFILPGPILYFLFKNEFAFLKKKEHFFLFLMCCAAIVAIIGIAEFFSRKNIIYEEWISNDFFAFFNYQNRAMSTQFVPQVFALFLGASLPFFYNLFFKAKNLFLKLIAVFFVLLIVAGILVSFTRGVLLAVFLASLLYASLKKPKMGRYIILIFLVIVLLSSFGKANYILPFYRFSFSMMIDSSARLKSWAIALHMTQDHPFKGVGVGQYRVHYGSYDSSMVQEYAKIPDNMFLTILAEGGIFVFLCFLIFIFLLLWGALRHIRLKRADSDLVLALSTGIIVISIAMVYFDALYWVVPLYIFWIYCGILSALTESKK